MPHAWRGRVGLIGLIVAEASLFAVFVVAYLFYIGKSLNGPYPKDVLDLHHWSLTIPVDSRSRSQSKTGRPSCFDELVSSPPRFSSLKCQTPPSASR